MDDKVIGALAVIAGGVLTAVITIILAGLRQRHERAERRYDDKRSTYVAFALACRDSVRRGERFEDRHGILPGDMYDEVYDDSELVEPFEMLEIYAPERVQRAGNTYKQAINTWLFGTGTPAQIQEARRSYMAAMRADLKLISR